MKAQKDAKANEFEYLIKRMKGTYKKDDGGCLPIELNRNKSLKISDGTSKV